MHSNANSLRTSPHNPRVDVWVWKVECLLDSSWGEECSRQKSSFLLEAEAGGDEVADAFGLTAHLHSDDRGGLLESPARPPQKLDSVWTVMLRFV